MTAGLAALEAAIAARDEDAVIAWLEASTEADRRAARPLAQRFDEELWGTQWEPVSDEPNAPLRPTAARLLAEGLRLAVERPSERFRVGAPGARLGGRIGEALGADWVRATLPHATPFGNHHRVPFRIVREWVRRGLCERPADDWYVLGFMKNLLEHGDPDRITVLRRDPGLLDHEIWQLFEIEGESDCCLAGMDKFERDGWGDTFLRLVAEGDLDRGRVLDAALGTLARDWPQFRAGWFSRLHDALEPSPAEVVARKETYLRLLGSRIPPTVALAARALDALEREDALDAADLAAHARPALRARAMKTANAVLAHLRRAAKREPDRALKLLEVAAEALLHEKPAVQRRALDLLEELGSTDDTALRAAVARAADAVAPTLSERLARWCDARASPSDVPDLPAEPTWPPLLDDARRITPLDDPMELVVACTRLVDDAGDALEMERALDGLARNGAVVRRTDAALLAPLRKRALRISRRPGVETELWYGRSRDHERVRRVEDDVARVVRAWVVEDDGDDPLDDADVEGAPLLAGLLFRRFREVVVLLHEGRSVALHSAPTHEGGWIAADVLAARRAADPEGAGPADRALAALREAPAEGHAGLVVRAAGEGAPAIERVVNPNGWVWHRVTMPPVPAGSMRVDDPERGLPRIYHEGPAILRWLATATPRDPEPLVALGTAVIGRGLDVTQSRGDAALFLEPLLDGWRPIDGPAASLVALALGAKEPACHGMALDVIVAGAESGRLPANALGAALAFWLPRGLIPSRRWARLLGEAAQISPAHARYVARALAATLRGDPADAPRELWALLEVLAQALAAGGARLDDVNAAAYLRGLGVGGKTRRLARTLIDG